MKTPLSLLLLCISFCGHSQTISTIAGNGAPGFSGDSSAATSAQLNLPFNLALDGSGNIYVADRLNNRIRKVNAAGIITTVAGTNTAGYNGDEIVADTAQLNGPVGVAIDRYGNIYVADKGNNRVRKISNSGTIATVAGNGTPGFSGDSGMAVSAMLNSPRSVAVDTSGNIYIADQGNNRIRMVATSGIITTIAGTATSGYNGDGIPATNSELNGPYCVVVDISGTIYIADVDNERFRKINTAGIISTIAGTGTSGFSGDNGPATAALLSEPIGVAVDSSGQVYIADEWNARVRKISKDGTITTIAGNGTAGYNGDGVPAATAQLNNPTGVAVTNMGDIYIADYSNSRIRFVAHNDLVSNTSSHRVEINVYPNPTNGAFTLCITTANPEPVSVTITNLEGQTVKKFTMVSNSEFIVKLNEPPGIYLIRATGANSTLSHEILITR